MDRWRLVRSYLPYGVLMMLIMAPLLLPGYILTLDMVFTPHIPAPTTIDSHFILYGALHLANILLPSDVLQKILLCAGLLAASIGAHRLVRLHWPQIGASAYVAGTLYAVNPFVYSRFMAGQYLVLLGYALLPFIAASAWRFLQKPTRDTAVRLAAWLIGMSLLSLHMLGIAIILITCIAGTEWWRHRTSAGIRSVARYGSLAAGLVLLASSYWLLPLLSGKGTTAAVIQSFGAADRTAFAATGGDIGVLGNLLTLQGFWADSKNLYFVTSDLFAWWWMPFIALGTILVIGAWYGWNRNRSYSATFGIIGILAVVLASGGGLGDWLAAHVPLFAGYREPHKFIALLCLSYSFWAALGAYKIGEWAATHPRWRLRPARLAAALCVIPLLCAPLALGGFAGQLGVRHYPDDWFTINNYLRRTHAKGQVVFLPWHMYMRFGFAKRVIANPASKFFDVPIIISADPELGGAKSHQPTAAQQEIQNYILPAAMRGDRHMGAKLRAIGVQYILMAKEFDYKKYQFVDTQSDIKKVIDTPTLALYQVLVAPTVGARPQSSSAPSQSALNPGRDR